MPLITDPNSESLANSCKRETPMLDFDGGFLDVPPPGEFIGPPTKQEWYGDCMCDYWYGDMTEAQFIELTGVKPVSFLPNGGVPAV